VFSLAETKRKWLVWLGYYRHHHHHRHQLHYYYLNPGPRATKSARMLASALS
jgi:hypothetical protein